MLEVDLIVPLQLTGTHGAHLLDWEVHNDSLLDPLVYLPLAILQIDWLGSTKLAFVHSLDNGTNCRLYLLLLEHCAILPRLLYYSFKFRKIAHVLLYFIFFLQR